MLVEAYGRLLEKGWQPVFRQARPHERALEHAGGAGTAYRLAHHLSAGPFRSGDCCFPITARARWRPAVCRCALRKPRW